MGKHFQQSKRELWVILGAWLAFCIWVVGYCALNAYDLDPEQISITFGMPSWVFWGIALPWGCAAAFTVFFGMRIAKDQPLE